MTTDEKERFIRRIAKKNELDFTASRILWSHHSIERKRNLGLTRTDIEQSLKNAGVIEDYGVVGRPMPDCLVLSFIKKKPIHSVVAVDVEEERIIIVTVYQPTRERWTNDWKKRKK